MAMKVVKEAARRVEEWARNDYFTKREKNAGEEKMYIQQLLEEQKATDMTEAEELSKRKLHVSKSDSSYRAIFETDELGVNLGDIYMAFTDPELPGPLGVGSRAMLRDTYRKLDNAYGI